MEQNRKRSRGQGSGQRWPAGARRGQVAFSQFPRLWFSNQTASLISVLLAARGDWASLQGENLSLLLSPQNLGKREGGSPAWAAHTPCLQFLLPRNGRRWSQTHTANSYGFFVHWGSTGCFPLTYKKSHHPAKLACFQGFLEDLVVSFIFYFLAALISVAINDRIWHRTTPGHLSTTFSTVQPHACSCTTQAQGKGESLGIFLCKSHLRARGWRLGYGKGTEFQFIPNQTQTCPGLLLHRDFSIIASHFWGDRDNQSTCL